MSTPILTSGIGKDPFLGYFVTIDFNGKLYRYFSDEYNLRKWVAYYRKARGKAIPQLKKIATKVHKKDSGGGWSIVSDFDPIAAYLAEEKMNDIEKMMES